MRTSFIVGLGLIVLIGLVGLAGGLVFASDASPSQEPAGSPYFEATLRQAVDELDGKAQPVVPQDTYQPDFTASPDVWPECFTRDLAYGPRCHFTTDVEQWPASCTIPYPTEDYTWDAALWAACGTPVTVDPGVVWCDPTWTSNPQVASCDPNYTMAVDLWPWCNPLYTWDTVRWPMCPEQAPYYTDSPLFPECVSPEFTTDTSRWSQCHYTSDPLAFPECQEAYPTQDYTSNPVLWQWCPGPGYTTNTQSWPWCNPQFTAEPTLPECETYTADAQAWPWCTDPTYTQDPALWETCHFTSDAAAWPACDNPYPTKDYTEDLNLWPDCRLLTQDPGTWPACSSTYTRDGAEWPWCDPLWTWDSQIWPQCAPGYTYDPGVVPCGELPYTEATAGWPECAYPTVDANIWPQCHYTSDPQAPDCIEKPPFATKDYTTDPRLWPECGPEPGDLGDAPDSTNHAAAAMSAYPAVQAHYPTVYDSATGLPQGPKHWQPQGDAWLGPWVSSELDADQLPDADGLTNIDPPGDMPDRDGHDDGVLLPLALPPCVPTTMTYTVTITPGSPLIDRFVNVWFDWNRDGDWGDTLSCSPTGGAPLAPEWAVQNQLIPAGLPPGTYLMTSPLFVPWHPTAAPLPAQWLRITLAEQKAGGTLPPDGRGPTPGYRFGETEDYIFVPDCPLPVAGFAWDPTTPCVNSPVQFWDQSSGALTWQWNFGGLGSSAAQNPSFTFTGAGSYNVTLAVTNACGSAQVTKPVTVRDCNQQSYDIWLKDSNPDDGSVPSPSPWWVSPDIWVRHDGDCTNTSHQNPIPGLATTVCIRVRNRLATPVENITVNAYYANAALALTWPGSWAYVSSFTIPSLAGSAITTQSVPWNVPAITGHFCLLARADAVKDPLPSGPDTTAPVNHPPNNNNVAQKNTNVVDQAPPVQACGFYSTTLVTQRFEFDVVNTWSSSLRADVELSSSDYPAGATLVLDPGVLWGRWTGLEHLTPAGSTLELDGGLPAAMRGLLLDPSMVARVAMTITAPIDQHFAVNITQIISDTEVGGIQFLRDIPICLYLPVITKNH